MSKSKSLKDRLGELNSKAQSVLFLLLIVPVFALAMFMICFFVSIPFAAGIKPDDVREYMKEAEPLLEVVVLWFSRLVGPPFVLFLLSMFLDPFVNEVGEIEMPWPDEDDPEGN